MWIKFAQYGPKENNKKNKKKITFLNQTQVQADNFAVKSRICIHSLIFCIPTLKQYPTLWFVTEN